MTVRAQDRGLAQRLAEAEATIAALLSGQIDAVIDPQTKTPLLLAKAQASLLESEERYRRIVETTSDGIGTLDTHSTFTFANRRLSELLGYRTEEIIGSPLSRFMREAPEPGSALVAASEGVEHAFRRNDGSELWALLTARTILDAEQKPAGTLLMLSDRTRHREDLTVRKKLESQLMVKDRMASVGTLAAGVAHEINNPLAVVIANLEYVRAEAASGIMTAGASDVHAALAEAADAAERVRLIVRDLKIFSRAPSDDSTASVNVQTLLESSLRMGWNEIRHRARLGVSYGAVPDVEANEARLGQVFLNLIVNATQALPEGQADVHRIDVSTRLEGDRVVVSVRDTGRGIAPEHMDRLFDAFFTTKSAGAGPGLGLTICQHIVRDMDGEITVESVLGKGTEFRVFLPVSRPDEQPVRRAAARVAVPGGRARILVVDDEPMLRQAVQRILGKSYEVVAAESAKQALAWCATGDRFDLVLCDLMMPDMNGMELHDELRRTCASRIGRILFMTGGAFTEPAQRFVSQLEEDHLEKPFSPRALRELVKKYVG